MSRNALRRVLQIGLLALAGLMAAWPAAVAEQPGWDWSGAARDEPAVSRSDGASASGDPTDGQAGNTSGDGAAVNSGVAGAISSIMQPNRGPALSNDAEIEALRRRAQTGQPLPR